MLKASLPPLIRIPLPYLIGPYRHEAIVDEVRGFLLCRAVDLALLAAKTLREGWLEGDGDREKWLARCALAHIASGDLERAKEVILLPQRDSFFRDQLICVWVRSYLERELSQFRGFAGAFFTRYPRLQDAVDAFPEIKEVFSFYTLWQTDPNARNEDLEFDVPSFLEMKTPDCLLSYD